MNKRAFVQLSLAMIIFGSIGFFSRLTGLPSLELVFIRCVSASVFLASYWVISGRYKHENLKIKEWPAIAVGGVLLVLNWIFFFASFEKTAITVAVSIYNLAPIIALFIGWIALKERVKWLGVLAVALAFIGTVFISGISPADFKRGLSVQGPLFAFLAACLYALVVITGKHIKLASPYFVTLIQTFIGVIILLPFVHFSFYLHLSAANWFYSILTGVVHTGLVYLLFYGSIRALPASIISALTYLDPLVAIMLDVCITGFVPSFLQTAGICMILISLIYPMTKGSKTEMGETRNQVPS